MKKRKLVVVLLAIIMTLSVIMTSASAASIPSIGPDTSTTGVPSIVPDSGAAIPSIVPDSGIPNVPSIVPQPSDYIIRTLNVSVDGVLVPDVYVYQDIYGFFRLYSAEALKKIFPRELNQASISFNANDGIVIDTYLKYFGYTADVYNNTLRIYTHKSDAVQYFKVYTNGLYTGTTNDPKSLKVPANSKVIYSGNRIYINNDGNSPVEIYVKGNLVQFPDQQPFISSNRTMVPIRAVAEMLDCKVDWNAEFNCAIITRGSHTVNIFPGKTGYLVDGKYYDMDVVPVIVNNRTMVPIRFVAEAFGFKVGFNSGTIPTVTLD